MMASKPEVALNSSGICPYPSSASPSPPQMSSFSATHAHPSPLSNAVVHASASSTPQLATLPVSSGVPSPIHSHMGSPLQPASGAGVGALHLPRSMHTHHHHYNGNKNATQNSGSRNHSNTLKSPGMRPTPSPSSPLVYSANTSSTTQSPVILRQQSITIRVAGEMIPSPLGLQARAAPSPFMGSATSVPGGGHRSSHTTTPPSPLMCLNSAGSIVEHYSQNIPPGILLQRGQSIPSVRVGVAHTPQQQPQAGIGGFSWESSSNPVLLPSHSPSPFCGEDAEERPNEASNRTFRASNPTPSDAGLDRSASPGTGGAHISLAHRTNAMPLAHSPFGSTVIIVPPNSNVSGPSSSPSSALRTVSHQPYRPVTTSTATAPILPAAATGPDPTPTPTRTMTSTAQPFRSPSRVGGEHQPYTDSALNRCMPSPMGPSTPEGIPLVQLMNQTDTHIDENVNARYVILRTSHSHQSRHAQQYVLPQAMPSQPREAACDDGTNQSNAPPVPHRQPQQQPRYPNRPPPTDGGCYTTAPLPPPPPHQQQYQGPYYGHNRGNSTQYPSRGYDYHDYGTAPAQPDPTYPLQYHHQQPPAPYNRSADAVNYSGHADYGPMPHGMVGHFSATVDPGSGYCAPYK